jgi:hypothetical protein
MVFTERCKNLGRDSHSSKKAEPTTMKKGMMIQKKIPPKIIAISRWALLYSRSDHFLYIFIGISASPRPFLFCLSTAWLSRMAAARLKMPNFDPIISKKKP